MKKVICIIITILLITILVGCAPITIDENGYPVDSLAGYTDYIVISNGKNYHLTYNKNTHIIYEAHCVHGGHSLIPYYMIGEDGCVHFAKWKDGKIIEIPNKPLN